MKHNLLKSPILQGNFSFEWACSQLNCWQKDFVLKEQLFCFYQMITEKQIVKEMILLGRSSGGHSMA